MGNAEAEIIAFIGSYGWLFITGFAAVLFKDVISNMVSSVFVFYGNDINDDDVLVVDGRLARVVRVAPFKTTFYLYMIDDKGNFINGTRMQVENSKLKDLKIEKPLPMFDDNLILANKVQTEETT